VATHARVHHRETETRSFVALRREEGLERTPFHLGWHAWSRVLQHPIVIAQALMTRYGTTRDDATVVVVC
jgi:hypothetical protein